MKPNKNINLDEIMNNEKLTKEEKVQAIKDYYEQYRKELDKELNKYIAKQYIGAALEIGSTTLPMGGIGKVGATIGKDLLVKNLGRKVSENIGSGILSGGGSGAVFGFGHGLMNDENPVVSSFLGGLGGGITGGTVGAIGANIQKATRGQLLKNYGNIYDMENDLLKNFRKDVKPIYQDYVQDIKLNRDGIINFTGRGLQEQLRWNPEQAKNFTELVQDIKNAKRLPDVPNLKPEQKPFVDHYELYQGKNGLHHIEVLKSGERRFYITKDTPNGTPRTNSTGSTRSSNNIINDNERNFNPAQVAIPVNTSDNESNNNNSVLYGYVQKNDWDTTPADSQEGNIPSGYAAPIDYNHIFTPEEIGNMTSKEFEQNEALIIQQLKNGQIQNQKPQPDYTTFKNTESGKNLIFTREDIDKMSNEEFTKHEQEIMSQMNSVGIPYKNDLPDNIKTYEKEIRFKSFR